MRKPRRDDLWDRTPGGLIVPRRVGLPTRRYIGKLGMVVDCCEEGICSHLSFAPPRTLLIELPAMSSSWCPNCATFGGQTYTTVDYSIDFGGLATCFWYYPLAYHCFFAPAYITFFVQSAVSGVSIHGDLAYPYNNAHFSIQDIPGSLDELDGWEMPFTGTSEPCDTTTGSAHIWLP